MSTTPTIPFILSLCTFCFVVTAAVAQQQSAEQPPNVVIIFIDDMGYADIGPFGADGYDTPNLDRLAAEGRRFTDFSVSAPVCSASRAALLTGCLHPRVGISGALDHRAEIGLNPEETTIAELCKQRGYATAAFGKWHLGHHPKFLPTSHGFDEFLGIPYSNDMWPYHPKYAGLPANAPERKNGYPPLPLIENESIVDSEVTPKDQAQLTRRFTKRAVDFIDRNRDQPFFLYLPHPMVHVPLFVSEAFEGKSGAGPYGDVVMEIDWSVGQIVKALERNGIEDNTLLVFTSDNGPWLAYGDHGGSSGPLREGKQTVFEGGVRVPTLFWWPGRIPANTNCDAFASTIDLLPTIAGLIDAQLPSRPIDGKDISSLLFEPIVAASPHAYFPLYFRGELKAIRNERWKLVFPLAHPSLGGRPGGTGGLPTKLDHPVAEYALYDLAHDPGERRNLIDQHPEITRELAQAADRYRAELGDRATDTEGAAVRQAGKLSPSDARLDW